MTTSEDTTEAAVLAEMQRQYQYATPVSHILVEGVLYLRCQRCRRRPVPHGAFITLCDPCLDDAAEKAGSLTA